MGTKDFDKLTVKLLSRHGISIIGTTALPDETGSFLNSVRGYKLNDNGTGRILTHAGVLALCSDIDAREDGEGGES